jgi:pimeloyl-ACP methyl ester carboxylesterase
VLISPIDPALPYGPPSLEKVATTPWWHVEMGELSGVLREKVALGARQSFVNPDNMPREQVDDLLEILADNHKRNVAQDMLKTVLPTLTVDGVYYPDWEETERIVDLQRAFGERDDLAFLMIAGERDEVAPNAMAYRLATQLANSRLVTIARTKHSPHIERAALTAELIEWFVREGEETALAPPARFEVVEQRVDHIK